MGRDISATSQPHTPLLGHLQTTTTTTYEGRASLEADLALADELTMACVREFFFEPSRRSSDSGVVAHGGRTRHWEVGFYKVDD